MKRVPRSVPRRGFCIVPQFGRPAASALAVALLLSACAAPQPGLNVAASSVQAPPNVPLATKPTTGEEARAVVNDQIAITFTDGSAALSDDANKKLDLAARLFRDANPVLMFTTGHSDNSGDEYANLLLSARRAQAVKKALVARGIPADRLLLRAMGASDPVTNEAPSAAENRRVVVTWRLV